MALLWNWFWADNVTSEEQEKARGIHKRLVAELNDVFTIKQTKKHAERGFDSDAVFRELTFRLNVLQGIHDKLSMADNVLVYPTPRVKQELHDALRNYLDCLVSNKEYLASMPRLQVLTADNLITFVNREGLSFPWHYRVLFRRDLDVDVLDKKRALHEIEHGAEDSLFSDDSSSEDEFYQRV